MVETTNEIHVFDDSARARQWQRIRKDFSQHDFLFGWAERQILDRLQDIKRKFPTALQLGGRQSQGFTGDLKNIAGVQSLECLEQIPEFLPEYHEKFDLIFSTLSLHAINDLPGLLIQIRRALKPDGVFIASMFGGETLHELRESLMQAELKIKGGISPRIFPFADKQQMGALLQRAGVALPVIDSEIITVTYENVFKLMHDLRGMGEANVIAARNKTNPGKALFFEAAQYYKDHYKDNDERIAASFEIIFLLGWAPHESQQQPLKPGSAKTRLADALKTTELQS